jgi:regulator of protease activity HflC (stomatin/prohibitin superfamily)
MLRFVLGCVLVLLCLLLCAVSFLSSVRRRSLERDGADDPGNERKLRALQDRRSTLRAATIVTMLGAVLMLAWSTIRVVPANTIGIPTTFGAIGQPLDAGIQLTEPWTEITLLSTRIQELSMLRAVDDGDRPTDDSITVIARGGGSMSVDLTVRYAIEPSEAENLFRLAGSLDLIKDRFVRPDAREVTRNVFSLYTADEGYSTERAAIADEIFDQLQERLGRRGIVLDSVNVRDVDPEDDVLAAINSILQARNDALRAAEEQRRLITEAETRREVAARDAEAAALAAEGEAEAIRIRAEAEAAANAQIAASLTPDLIELQITQACAEAIAQTQAAVVSICGRSGTASSSGDGAGAEIIVDARNP